MLKRYFFLKFDFFYFKKYLIKRQDWLKYDIEYIEKLDELKLNNLARYIYSKSNTTLVCDFIKSEIPNQEILIITVASARLVSQILALIGIENYQIYGSKIDSLINGDIKSQFIKKMRNIVFFTDSMNDYPCFKYAELIIYSEYAEKSLLDYVINKSNCCSIKNFKI